MYGMVNAAIKQHITTAYGTETWNAVFSTSGLQSDDFYHMEAYEDSESVSLVVSASQVLDKTPGEFLEEFGEYWITYARNSDYADMLEMAGDTLPEILMNLDSMHARIGFSFEALQPPSFWCTEVEEGSLNLHYVSDRSGLSAMVIGLVKGLGNMVKVECEVTQVAFKDQGAEHDIFSVTYTTVDSVTEHASSVAST